MMRFVFLFFLVSLYCSAQNCHYEIDFQNDSLSYRETKKFLIYEHEFGKKSNYMFLSLANDNGFPILNLQRVQKSDTFIETECLDKNSRIFIQLTNGKIYTLIHQEKEVCSARFSTGTPENVRVLNSTFFFMKDDFEDLKKHPVSLMQIRYGTGDKTHYVFEKELISKNLGVTTEPQKFFIENYSCVE
ncbi:MAG: hypothetical protein WCY89_01975 [Flavobacteriaceae bacterium]